MGSGTHRFALVVSAVGLAWTCLTALPARADQERKWAIVIGIQRYSEAKGFAALRYAENDAEAVYRLLVDPARGGYEPSRVKLLTSASNDPEQWPTRGNILATLSLLANWSRTDPTHPPDTILVYFSGHGVEEAGLSYMVPSDATKDDLANTAIALETVRDRLARCGARKQIIIMDACRSQASPGKAGGDQQSIEFARALEEFAKAQGRVVLASCSAQQASYEDDANKHSAFTRFLLDGLQGAADLNRDGVITLTESYEYLSSELRTWAEKRGVVQYPSLYGEISLTVPLVRCPTRADLRVISAPADAEVWINGENTGKRTPSVHEIALGTAPERKLRLRLAKEGFQDLEYDLTLRAGETRALELALRQPQLAKLPPDLRPVPAGMTATTFYDEAGYIGGMACRSDGSVLVAVSQPDMAPQGIYVAREGDDCDLGDAYSAPGLPFVSLSSVALHPDGRVFVADKGKSAVWSVSGAGAAPQIVANLTDPSDVLVVPAAFSGPQVRPGDLLVCVSGFEDPAVYGLYVIDTETGETKRLVGSPQLQDGLVHAAFGPDGTLYAMESDDRNQDGVRIVTVSPEGRVAPFLDNYFISPSARQSGPLAVHPRTGDVYFAHRASVYRVIRNTGAVELFAVGGVSVTDLEFTADGSSLFASDAGAGLIAKIGTPHIDGQLVLTTLDKSGSHSSYVISGSLDNMTTTSKLYYQADTSVTGQLLYGENVYWHPRDLWRIRSDIWRADSDGSNPVNLTGRARLGGINCPGKWSPDGSRVVFQHCDPVKGVMPCRSGFDVWVMNADGSGAQQLTHREAVSTHAASWSPQGDAVLCDQVLSLDPPKHRAIRVSLDTGVIEALPNVGEGPVYSPDGSRILSHCTEPTSVEGEEGVWRELRVTKPDGSDPQPLVQQFVSNADMQLHFRMFGKNPRDDREVRSFQSWVGPYLGTWSPRGDAIVFVAALPFQAEGQLYKLQDEVWMYDLRTRVLARLTNNDLSEEMLSWRGPNTYTGQREVMIGNVKVTFDEVTADGVTTVTRTHGPTDTPGALRFGDDYYVIKTSAKHSGPVTVSIAYSEQDTTPAEEGSAYLLWRSPVTGQWENVTTSRDVEANVVSGMMSLL